jgi:hypothetical protein
MPGEICRLYLQAREGLEIGVDDNSRRLITSRIYFIKQPIPFASRRRNYRFQQRNM